MLHWLPVPWRGHSRPHPPGHCGSSPVCTQHCPLSAEALRGTAATSQSLHVSRGSFPLLAFLATTPLRSPQHSEYRKNSHQSSQTQWHSHPFFGSLCLKLLKRQKRGQRPKSTDPDSPQTPLLSCSGSLCSVPAALKVPVGGWVMVGRDQRGRVPSGQDLLGGGAAIWLGLAPAGLFTALMSLDHRNQGPDGGLRNLL